MSINERPAITHAESSVGIHNTFAPNLTEPTEVCRAADIVWVRHPMGRLSNFLGTCLTGRAKRARLEIVP